MGRKLLLSEIVSGELQTRPKVLARMCDNIANASSAQKRVWQNSRRSFTCLVAAGPGRTIIGENMKGNVSRLMGATTTVRRNSTIQHMGSVRV